MDARVTFNPSTLKQESTKGLILKYLQEHPNVARDTNIKQLTDIIAPNIARSSSTIKVNIQRMVNNQMLSRYGGKHRARFIINYFHKDIPGYILEGAPQDIKEKVDAMKKNLAENQYISDEGCVVTKGDKKPKDEKPVEEPVETKVEVKPEEEKTEKQNVVVPVEIKDNEKGINLTITLNLTINR